MRPILPVIALLGLAVSVPPAAATEARTTLGGGNEYLTKGADAMRTGDFEDGIELTLRGLRLFPAPRDRAAALSNLCGGYASTGEYDLAIESCNESLQLNSRSWKTYHNRALTLLRMGMIDEAIEDLHTGLELNPEGRVLLRTLSVANRLKRKPRVIMEEDNPR